MPLEIQILSVLLVFTHVSVFEISVLFVFIVLILIINIFYLATNWRHCLHRYLSFICFKFYNIIHFLSRIFSQFLQKLIIIQLLFALLL